MDFKDQLKNLFPEHKETVEPEVKKSTIWLQDAPILCKYEKRKGKPITILEGYTGASADFKILAKEIKTKLSVGGSFKDDKIIIELKAVAKIGNEHRAQVINYLKATGYKLGILVNFGKYPKLEYERIVFEKKR